MVPEDESNVREGKEAGQGAKGSHLKPNTESRGSELETRSPRPTTRDPPPPISLDALMVPQPPQIVPQTGDKVFNYAYGGYLLFTTATITK